MVNVSSADKINKKDIEVDIFKLENEISPKLFALHARLKLGLQFSKSTLVRAFIDSRITSGIKFAPNNESLSTLGACIMKYYVSEYLVSRWPRLPYNILRAAMWGYCGSKALARVGREWGIEMSDKEVRILHESSESELRGTVSEILSEAKKGMLVFKRTGWIPNYNSFLKDRFDEVAVSGVVKSIIGGVYLHCGLHDVRIFINDHIISRHLSIPSLFSFDQPTRELSMLCSRQKLKPPVSRLIAETGRRSSSPLFIASIDALKAWYLYESKGFDRPSKSLENNKEIYTPVHIDCGEVIV
ncbi:hypothetical protein PMAC_001128 [Pneumocystis sp. 'macacae']|nr:hypothetical protein PMAC_001128 [Pneumocystis sp. 'macacae']